MSISLSIAFEGKIMSILSIISLKAYKCCVNRKAENLSAEVALIKALILFNIILLFL